MSAPDYYRAACDFTFGGISVQEGDIVPCHRPPWDTLLHFGAMYVLPVQVADPDEPA